MISRTSASTGGATLVPASPARSSRKIHGRPWAARPIITPSAPLCSSAFKALAAQSMSPLTNTGRLHGPLDGRDGFVFGIAAEKIRARAPVHGERSDAFALRDARDRDGVAVLPVPASAHLERDRNAGRGDDRREYLSHQWLVAHQRGSGGAAADLLRGAAEIDVDDLRAHFDIEARGVGHHRGVVASDLHDAGLRFAAMIEPQPRLGRIPEPDVGSHHFRWRRGRRPCAGTAAGTAGR